MTLEKDRDRVLAELEKQIHGISQQGLSGILGIGKSRVSQILVKLRNEGLVVNKGSAWKIYHTPEKPVQKVKTIDEIVIDFGQRDIEQTAVSISSEELLVLSNIRSNLEAARMPFIYSAAIKNPPGNLQDILETLHEKNVIFMEDSGRIALLRDGLYKIDSHWTCSRIGYMVLDAIKATNDEKDPENKPTPDLIRRRTGLHNWNLFTDMLDYFIKNEIVDYEELGRQRAYTIRPKGIELIGRLRTIVDPTAPKPKPEAKPVETKAPEQLRPAPAPPKPAPQPAPAPVQPAPQPAPVQMPADPKPAPAPVQTPAPASLAEKLEPEFKEIFFSWGREKVRKIKVGDFTYKVVVVGTAGRLDRRKIEAGSKGCAGLTRYEYDYLLELTKYVSNETFDLQTAIKETGLPRPKILDLLYKYSARGITFPGMGDAHVSLSPTPSTYAAILEQNKGGQLQSQNALENLIKILETKDAEMSEMKKRLEILEQKK